MRTQADVGVAVILLITVIVCSLMARQYVKEQREARKEGHR